MTADANATQGKRRQKGPRPKHVPRRMCVCCRERSTKRALTRVVRTPEGPVLIDPSGKKNGRGAYLCDQRACWERAINTSVLGNALKTEIDAETAAMLRQFAVGLPASDAPAAVAEEG